MRASSKKLPKAHTTIDAPVFIWHRVHESGDLSWLLEKRIKLTKRLRTYLKKVWEKIYDEYLHEFGFSENFIAIKEKEIEIAQLKCELILTGDRINETWIEIAEIELTDMKKGNGKGDFMQSKIAIESKFKFQINMTTTSIREFYSYLKHLK